METKTKFSKIGGGGNFSVTVGPDTNLLLSARTTGNWVKMAESDPPQHPLIEPSMPGIPGIVKDGIFFSLVDANEDTKKLTARYVH